MLLCIFTYLYICQDLPRISVLFEAFRSLRWASPTGHRRHRTDRSLVRTDRSPSTRTRSFRLGLVLAEGRSKRSLVTGMSCYRSKKRTTTIHWSWDRPNRSPSLACSQRVLLGSKGSVEEARFFGEFDRAPVPSEKRLLQNFCRSGRGGSWKSCINFPIQQGSRELQGAKREPPCGRVTNSREPGD